MKAKHDDAPRTIRVNGRECRLERRQLLPQLTLLGYEELEGIAVAINGEIVPRAEWRRRQLCPGDAIEIVGAVQGG